MNRITDERLESYENTGDFKPAEFYMIVKELLTLRKENKERIDDIEAMHSLASISVNATMDLIKAVKEIKALEKENAAQKEAIEGLELMLELATSAPV